MTSFIPAVSVCFVYRRVNASATDIFSFGSCLLCVCVSVCLGSLPWRVTRRWSRLRVVLLSVVGGRKESHTHRNKK